MRAKGFFQIWILGLAVGMIVAGVAPVAQAAPDQSGSSIIDEPNGAPPFCTQPCYSVEKAFEVYLSGNPTVPAGPSCAAGENTYLYTISHIGGTGPFVPSVTAFELGMAAADVSSAGFIPGVLDPSATVIQANAVRWDFPAPGAVGPAASGGGGLVSSQLFICSTLLPGTIGDTMVSFDGTLALDAPGTCVGPFVPPPPACDLEIDKTCCIPQPDVPFGDACQGKLTRLVLEYTGDDCSASDNDQGKKSKCSGGAPGAPIGVVATGKSAGDFNISPSSGVNVGDQVEITHDNIEFKASTKLRLNGPDDDQDITIHTSCSRALRCDDQFGGMKVVGLTSTEGGIVDCNAGPPPAEPGTECTAPAAPGGTECDGKIVELVFAYNGAACADPLANPQGGKATCDGDATGSVNVGIIYTGKNPGDFTVSPASMINDGDQVRLTATGADFLKASTKLQIVDSNSVEQSLTIHTSCSQPLALGDVFGSLTIIGMTTENGEIELSNPETPIFQDSCEVPFSPPSPHCTSKLNSLTLAYIGDFLGEGCAVSNAQDGKGSCSGVADPGDPVSVTITKDAGTVSATPDSGIGVFNLTTLSQAGDQLESSTEFDVTGAGGTQSIAIHTSCSQPLNLGDRFGSFVVFGMDRTDDGPIALGGVVEYQYKVTNPIANGVTVDNVTVVDDQVMGPIGSGISIPAGEMVTLFDTRTLYGTTTNVATVTGDVGGQACTEAMDSVEVTVTTPPAGPYACTKPMKRLAMVWDGLQDVRVVVWKGAVGSTQLADIPLVAPGDVVEVGGFATAPNDVIWEIFEPAPSAVKIGESKFHLSCSDPEMNGVEDCGRNEGNGKSNELGLINDWLLEEITDSGGKLDCTPDAVVQNPNPCGIGFELAFLMPPLAWAWMRRRRRTLA